MPSKVLSVVTISFNQRAYLREALDSVISEKTDDVEYILVDPGSTDGSRDVLKEYASDIDVLVLEPDNGPDDGLNKGFVHVTGEIGYLLNSDDFLLTGAISRLRRLWLANPGIDILLGGAWMVDAEGEPLRELEAMPADQQSMLSGDPPLVQQGMSFRLNRFRELGGFETVNRTCWDYELLLAMLQDGAKPWATAERFGASRMYGESLSGGVGGAEHMQRYFADLDRIYMKFTGRPRPIRSPAATVIYRARRIWTRPVSFASRVRDRLFPTSMRSRFREDQNDSGLMRG